MSADLTKADLMNADLITVTGYFGAPIEETARRIAAEHSIPLVLLDNEITERDGRSIQRLVMMNGEHAYRNKEFEILKELAEAGKPVVVACGDGVLYDDDSREIIRSGKLVIVGGDMSADSLWASAETIPASYHAFMSFGTDDEKRRAFDKLLQRQQRLFEEVE